MDLLSGIWFLFFLTADGFAGRVRWRPMRKEAPPLVCQFPTHLDMFKAMGRGRVTRRGVLVGVVLPGPAGKGLPHGW